MKQIAIIGLGTIGSELGPYLSERGALVYGVDDNHTARQQASSTKSFAKVCGDVAELPACLDAIFEATPEDPRLKARVLKRVSTLHGDAYLLSTSSTIPSSTYASIVENPRRLMNAHVLPDLRTRKFIELQQSVSGQEFEHVADGLSSYGFRVAMIDGESDGFIFNQIWHRVMFMVFELMESRAYQDIDRSCATHFNWPYGPVMAMDLIGFDTLYKVFSLVQASRGIDIPKIVVQMNTEHKLGLKSRRGFYRYESPDLRGFHDAAKEFLASHSGAVSEDLAERVWGTIKQCANTLLANGQRKSEIMKAIRHGFPLHERFDPFER